MVAKKIYKAAFKLLLLLVIVANMPLHLFADYLRDYSVGILYEYRENSTQDISTLCVIGTLDPELRNLDIPSKKQFSSWKEYTVTSIEGIDCRAEGEIFYPWSLQSIRIPKTVTSIKNGAFRSYHARQSKLEQYAGSVSELAEIIVDPENPNYTDVDGVLYNKNKSVLLACPPAKTEFVIPATVTEIANYAFSGCRNLKSLTIPNSVTQIGHHAFEGCTNLETVTFPKSSISIDQYAFEDCKSLVSLNISGTQTSIDRYAFKGCDSLVSIDISGTKTSIDSYAFKDCNSLVSIDISGSSIFIYEEAFEDCKSLVSLNLSGTQTSIRACAFKNCESLASIDISGSSIFIYEDAFEDCKSLASINLSGTKTSIGDRAFKDCESLVTLDFSDSLTSIGDFAFLNCKSLASVGFPASLSHIGKGIFYDCSQLKEIRVAPGNENFADVDRVLYNKDKSILTAFPPAREICNIPATVIEIDDYAFAGCSRLKKINVAPGNGKFADVDGVLYDKDLHELLMCPMAATGEYTIPSSVVTIGAGAFSGCVYMTSVTLPASVQMIKGEAFMGCTSLSEITLPASVYYIGDKAFRDCTSLLTIRAMRMRPPETSIFAFRGVPIEACVYVPKSTIPYYLQSRAWNGFDYYFEVEEWVTGISDITADSGNASQDVYTPQGVCIRRNATDADVKALPEGIYIIGGKKVYVK